MYAFELRSRHAFDTFAERLGVVMGKVDALVDLTGDRLVLQVPKEAVNQVAAGITSVLFREWLYDNLIRRARKSHEHVSRDELEYLSLVYLHEIRTEQTPLGDKTLEQWEEAVREEIASLVRAGTTLSIDGFTRFRLREPVSVLFDRFADRLRRFELDREYEESVAMLRFMLDEQPSIMQEVHVFCGRDRVWLTDEHGQLVRDEQIVQAAIESETVSYTI